MVAPKENSLMTFWEGSMCPTIKQCIESMRACYDTVTVFTLDDVPKTIKKRSKRGLQGLTDMFRLWAIYEYGGLWLDADILCFKPIPYAVYLESHELMGISNGWQGRVSNVAIAGRKGSELMHQIYHFGMTRNDKRVPGQRLNKVWITHPTKCLRRPKLDCVHPVRYKWEPYLSTQWETHPWYGGKSYHLGGRCIKWVETCQKRGPKTFVERLLASNDHESLDTIAVS